jgi:hypothetical protein
MSRVKKVPKPPAALIKKAKKYHVKVTKKVGRKRVYKRVSLIKKQIKKAMRKVRKGRKVRKVRKGRSRFGSNGTPATFDPSPARYNYYESVNQVPGTSSQSSSYVPSLERNQARPAGFQLPNESVPTFGTYKAFFGQDVPSVVPPNWNCLGQPDGSCVPVGSPFYGYQTPSTAFGRSRYGRKSRYGMKNPFAGMKNPFAGMNPFARKETPTWIVPENYTENTYTSDEVRSALVNYNKFIEQYITPEEIQSGPLLLKAITYMAQRINPQFEKFNYDDYKNAVIYLNNIWDKKYRDILFMFLNSLGYYANRDPRFILKYRPVNGFWQHLRETYDKNY